MRTRLNVSLRSRSNRNLEVLVFKERGKPEYPMKNLSEQGREPTTISTHIWRRRRDLNPGHIGGRRVLSPLRHPCSSKTHTFRRRLRPSVHVNTLSVVSENESIWKRSCKWIKTKTHTYYVSVDGRQKKRWLKVSQADVFVACTKSSTYATTGKFYRFRTF